MVSRFLKTALVLVFVAGVFGLFHREVLFNGKVYQNQWIFQDHAPFAPPAPSQINRLNQSSDLVTHYFPYKSLIERALRSGHAPLWNPYSFCGFPLYANGSAAVFSPVNALLLFWPPYEAYRGVLALYFLAGAFLLFVYLRRIGASRAAAAGGCLALVLSPFLAENVDFDTLHVFVWAFPLALLAAERLAEGKKGAVPLAAAALFLTALAGHIHVLINTAGLFVLYSAARRAPLPKIGGALALFGLLSAFLLYPMWSFLRSSQWITTSFAHPVSFGELWKLPITPLTALYPMAAKLPHFYEITGRAAHGLRFSSAMGVGIVPFVMGAAAILLVFSKAVDGRIRFFAAGVLLYHASTVVPPFFLVPGEIGRFLDQSADRLWQIYIFGSAVLAAWGIDAAASNERARKIVAVLAAVLAAAVALPVTLASAAVTLFGPAVEGKTASFLAARGLLEEGSKQAGRFPELFREARTLLSLSSPYILVPLAVLAGLAVLPALKNKTLARWGLAVVLLADLWVAGAGLLPKSVDPARVYPRTSVTDFLAKDTGIFRIMALQGPTRVLKPNLGVPYGLYDVGGHDSVLNSVYLQFARRYLANRPEGALTVKGILDFEGVNLNAASWLNVKYLLASDQAPPPGGLEKVFEGAGAAVYRNPGALPRVFFTRRYKKFTDPETAFSAMAEEAPGAEPVVAVESPNAPNEPRITTGTAERPEIRTFADEEIAVSIDTPENGWVVFTDNFDPGWTATDNGERVPVVRVNGLFKGVSIGRGKHAVRFAYRPAAFYRLLGLSALALVLTAWLLLRALL